MTLTDLSLLYQHSKEQCNKIHFKLNTTDKFGSISMSTVCHENFANEHIFNNVFTIHIGTVFVKTVHQVDNPFILTFYSSTGKMDSILIHSNGMNNNINEKEYERQITPIANLSELQFRISDINGNIIDLDYDLYITLIIRSLQPETQFENIYKELNPEYINNIRNDTLGNDFTSESEYDSEY